MADPYKAVTREELERELGRQCSPHPNYEGYVIGPDITGRRCHIGSYRSMAEARRVAFQANSRKAITTKPEAIATNEKPAT